MFHMRFNIVFPGIAQSLQRVLDGTIPGASPSEKAECLRLLGKLRYFRSAETMISHLATSFPGVESLSEHPAVLALADIQPSARPALLKHIKKTTDKEQRKRLVDALMYIEGDVAGKALLLADDVHTGVEMAEVGDSHLLSEKK